MATIKQTLGDIHWVLEHEEDLKSLFPDEFDIVGETSFTWRLVILGVEPANPTELKQVFQFLVKIGIAEQDGQRYRRNPKPIVEHLRQQGNSRTS